MRRTCFFSGRVQGVGFRYTVANLALQYNVKGFVRNTADNRVELVMEGPDDEMTGLLDEIRQKMADYIEDVSIQDSPGTNEFARFCVKH